MAVETTDYHAVLSFIREAKTREAYVPSPGAPEVLRDEPHRADLIPYLGLGLSADLAVQVDAGQRLAEYQVFAAGWCELEGVMILKPETDFPADVHATVAARNERALRDLLTAFPSGKTGFFYFAGEWMLSTLTEFFDGRVMPSREGYFATPTTFVPQRPHPARRLGTADYDLVRSQWSESVWNEMLADGYAVHACHVNSELCAACFHWPVAPWRHEVHGLQAVRTYTDGYAESVVTSATEEVLDEERVATCTANLSSARNYLGVFRNVGYQPFYRVHSFLGIKRGSGRFANVPDEEFFGYPRRTGLAPSQRLGEGGQISQSKDPVLAQLRDLAHTAGRREYSQFVVEGLTLVQRAIHDGLPVDVIVYTPDLTHAPEGVLLLSTARITGIRHYRVTEGLMGRITTTRPVPAVAAAVFAAFRDAASFKAGPGTTLLVAEAVSNPDNLGMVLRTADAAGIDGVVVIGENSDPFHKQCVRAARGAVGRIPILSCADAQSYLRHLRAEGFRIVGATGRAEMSLYHLETRPPIAVVVGNEQTGISPQILQACTDRVKIPMAPGQDSLNVGVASGVLLYELLRRKIAGIGAPLLGGYSRYSSEYLEVR